MTGWVGCSTTKFEGELTVVPNVNGLGFFEGECGAVRGCRSVQRLIARVLTYCCPVALDGVTVNGDDLGLTRRTAILDTGECETSCFSLAAAEPDRTLFRPQARPSWSSHRLTPPRSTLQSLDPRPTARATLRSLAPQPL